MPLFMRGHTKYVKFTQEQINRAQHVDLVEFLRSRGEKVYREGKEYVWDRHDSVRINGFMWVQNSNRENHGAAVKFLEHFYGMHFSDAVTALIGEAGLPQLDRESVINRPKVPFIMPEPNGDNRRMVAYLTKTRNLDYDVVDYFIEAGALFEDKRHNAVFTGYDLKGKPVFAFKRGTNTYMDKPYKGLQTGSDCTHPFRHTGTSERLYIFEAAIDMLSYICLNRNRNWLKDSYLPLGGLYDDALQQFLKENRHIEELVYCTDNDVNGRDEAGNPRNHGQEYARRSAERYTKKGYLTRIETPTLKDWNELLTSKDYRR